LPRPVALARPLPPGVTSRRDRDYQEGSNVTAKRKWVLRVGLLAVVLAAGAGTWAALHLDEVKAMYAARQLRHATTDDDRAKAADRLAALGDPGLERLVGFVRSGDDPARSAATAALDRHLDSLPEGDPRAAALGGRVLDALPACDAGGRRAVLELVPVILKKTGSAHAARCRDAVAAGLKMPDPAARVTAARLALLTDVNLRAEVLPLLSAPEPEVRQAALFAAACSPEGGQVIGDEELFRWLHDPDAGVRKVCRDALVSRDRSESEISLGGRLTHPDPLERLKLLMDLRYDDEVPDPDPWLERLGRDPEPAVRAGAARVAVEVAAERRLPCPGWVSRVADADADGTVRRVATFFRKQFAARTDPNVRPIDGP
jgi:hypothetical protein